MSEATIPPLPQVTATTLPFWQGLEDNKVMLQRCDDCEGFVFYPRSNCSHCLSANLTWCEVSGEGEVYSYTISRRPTAPQFIGMEPQYIVVIELDQGVRMNSVLVGVPEEDIESLLPLSGS